MKAPIGRHQTASESPKKNTLGTKVLNIAIGRDKTMFNLHEGKLQSTSFFSVHGPPPTDEQKRERFDTPEAPTGASSSMGNTPIKSEDLANDDNLTVVGDTTTDITNAGMAGAGTTELDRKYDYHLVSRFHTAKAFHIFAIWLYNEPVPKSKNKDDNLVLRQAYILALQYQAFDLQNKIMDRYREYHIKNAIVFDDLIWMINRNGDKVDSAMTHYLIEQIAYEITDGGFPKYEGENNGFASFLQFGDRIVRRNLFEAVARHAHASGGKLGDPAKTGADWHVVVEGEIAGQSC